MIFNTIQWRSLKTKMTLFTLIIFLIGIWSIALYARRVLRDDMERLLGEQQFSTVSLLSAQVNQELGERLKALETVAGEVSPAILDNTEPLQTVLEQHPVFQSLFNGGTAILNTDGTAVAEIPLSAGRIGVNYMDRDTVAAALKEGKATIGRPVIGKTLAAPILIMSVPIREPEGRVIGVLSGMVNLGLPNFLDKITDNHYGKTGGYVLLIPKYRMIVTATDKSRTMEKLPIPGINPQLDRFLDGYEGSAVYTNPLGVEVLGSAKRLPVSDWLMGCTLPTQEAFAPIRSMQQRVLLTTILITLLVVGLTWWMLSHLLSPMLAAARTLATLPDTGQSPQPLAITSRDEIGDLIGGFNCLLGTLVQREKALKWSEERHRTILHTAMNGFWVVDRQGQLLEVNEAYCRMSGYSAEELLAMRISDVEAAETDDETSTHIRKILAQGEDRFESRHRRKNGSIFNIEVSAQYQPIEGGRFVAFLQDITERKRIALYRDLSGQVLEILNESDDFQGRMIQRVLSAVKETTGCDAVGIRMQSGDDFPYLVQQGFSGDFLLTEDTLLIRDPDGRICREEDGSARLECTCGLVISGKTDPSNPLFTRGGSCWTNDRCPPADPWPDGDPRLHPRDRCLHDGYFSVALVPIRQKKKIVGLLQLNDRKQGKFSPDVINALEGIASHIGEAMLRKHAEDSLRESEAKYKALSENTSDWVWETDAKGVFTYANPKVKDILGYDPAEMIGKTPFDFMAPQEAERVFEFFQIHAKSGSPIKEAENTLIHKDGRAVTLEFSGIPFFDDRGYLLGYRGIDRDITQRKRAEAELHASKTFNLVILNAVPAEIAVLNPDGVIISVNESWRRFALENGIEPGKPAPHTGLGTNYLAVCRAGTGLTVDDPFDPHNGILSVMERRSTSFSLEYPCDSPNERRWFIMQVTPLSPDCGGGVVISHTNITALKLAEEVLKKSHDELESRVRDRTFDLTKAYEQLMAEVEERKCTEKMLEIQRDLQSMLSDSNEVLLLDKDREALLRSICEVAVRSGRFNLAWVGFPDSEKQVRIVSASGSSIGYLDGIEITSDGASVLGQGPTGTCIRTNCTSINDDFETMPGSHPWRQRAIAHGLRSSVAIPLREENRCVGAFTLYSPMPGFFTGERVTLLEQLASNLSYALDLFSANERQREALQALRLSEEKYRVVADNTYDWEFWVDPKGNFIYVSPACERVTGHTPGEFMSNRDLMAQMIHPEDVPRYQAHQHTAERNPAGEALSFRIRRPDGSERWIEHLCQPVFDIDGRFLGNRGNNRDVTTRILAEAKIRQSEKMLQAVFDAISDPLILVDHNLTIEMLNSAAVRYYRMDSPQSLIGKSGCMGFCLKRDRSGRCLLHSHFPGDNKVGCFERKGCVDPERMESITLFPVEGEKEEDSGIVIRVSDITETRMIEKAMIRSQKLASIGVLSSGVAHEINNPNNFIMFNIPVLRRYHGAMLPLVKEQLPVHDGTALFGMSFEEFERDLFQLTDSIETGSERIKTIVNELKDFSYLGDQTEMASGNPAQTIAQAVRISRVQLKGKVNRLDIDIPKGLPNAFFEAKGLEQVIVNILINAAHAADKQDSWVRLKAKIEGEEKRYFVIEIADNGCGMEENVLKKIFDPFFTTKPSGQGTGLGLYVCHNLIEKMGGHMDVESRICEGSTFRIMLRCKQNALERTHSLGADHE